MVRPLAAMAFLMAGCTVTVPTPVYSPASMERLDGGLSVGQFIYTPPDGTAQNAIQNDGLDWEIQEPMAVYVQRAVAMEMRQSGLALEGPCTLSGQIHQVKAEGHHYRSDITYRLSGGPSLEKRVAIDTATTWDFMPADIANYLNKSVAENVGALLADPEFQATIRDQCQDAR